MFNGPLVGSNFYEQARGILISAMGCTAEDAARVIGEAAALAGASPRDIVADLISPETRQAALQGIAALR
jgi:hypothetical protein